MNSRNSLLQIRNLGIKKKRKCSHECLFVIVVVVITGMFFVNVTILNFHLPLKNNIVEETNRRQIYQTDSMRDEQPTEMSKKEQVALKSITAQDHSIIKQPVSKDSSEETSQLSWGFHSPKGGPLFTQKPLVDRDCNLEFRDTEMVFCKVGDSLDQQIGILIARRLLEYAYRCSSASLPIIDIEREQRNKRNCFWARPVENAEQNDILWMMKHETRSFAIPIALLTRDLFQDYYWLPTTSVATKPYNFNATVCLIDGAELSPENHHFPQNWGKFLKMTNVSSRQNIFSFLGELRLCDMVASNILIPLILADSFGIPSIATSHQVKNEYIDYVHVINRTMPEWNDRFNFGPLSEEDRFDISSKMAKSFPLDLFSRSIPPSKKSLSDTKILVIIMGNIRGGEKAWQTFYKHMLDVNSADLALVIGKVPEMQRNSSLFARAKYLYEFPEFQDWGDAVEQEYGSDWKKYILPYANDKWGTFGGIGKKQGSGAVIFVIRWYVAKFLLENNLIEKYDRFVLTRSDHYYGCDHDLKLLDNEYMWVPKGEDYKYGITDRHLVCNQGQVLNALDIYPPILRNPEKFASKNFADKNPEELIRLRWEQEGLWPWVRRFDRVMFTCAIEGDKTRWTQKSKTTVKEGVFLKYEYEYEETTCVCKTAPCTFPFTKRKKRLGYPQRDIERVSH
mmetsp:Transcript_13139/g.20040  ORF Transcript_13139/g.20040 Transcript_13139/m.20040 type:complete len:678 (-) Transcript_13139:849-2882(-)